MSNQKSKKRQKQKCVFYARTSSATNVGENKDSFKRQKKKIVNYAKQNNLDVVSEFYDADVSGATIWKERRELDNAVAYCLENNINKIVIENADRIARDLVVQELTYQDFEKLNIEITSVENDKTFTKDNNLVRQMLGAISQYEKDKLVERLRVARERKCEENKKKNKTTLTGVGKCSGAKQYYIDTYPDLTKRIKKMQRQNKSLQQISNILAKDMIVNKQKKPIHPMQIKRIAEY